MTVETSNRLRLTRRFATAPERVFAAWFDPPTVRQWLFAAPSSEPLTVMAAASLKIGRKNPLPSAKKQFGASPGVRGWFLGIPEWLGMRPPGAWALKNRS